MEAHHREAVGFSRQLGAKRVRMGSNARHALLIFDHGGREHRIPMHRGNRTLQYHAPLVRSLIRKAIRGG